MNKLLLSLLAGASLMCLASCETGDYDDDDDDDDRRTTTTTTTEETMVRAPSTLVPITGSVQTTQTTTY